jgi:hypothetical protein
MRQNLLHVGATAFLIAIMVTAVAALTLAHGTFPTSGVGSLKCYTAGTVQKVC